MQDIDQAVENLLRVSDNDNIQVEPTSRAGYSDLNLLHTPSFPLSASAGLNNSGSKSQGWQQYFGSLTVNNIAGVNDIFNTFYSWNNLNNDKDSQDSLSLSYSVPLGYWLFDASYYQSSYEKTIGGMYGNYFTDGESQRRSLRVSRMLTRNATGKTSAYMKLEHRDNYNGMEHTQIDVSSKKYSSLSLGTNYVGALMNGWFYADIGATAGVPWFGAAWKNDPDLQGFELDYVKINGITSWTRPLLQFNRIGLTYEMGAGFQYTPNVLVIDVKMSLGDEFTVRGFKDDSLMVDNGGYISNTLQLPVSIGIYGVNQLTPFIGYDFGFAKDNCPKDVNICDSQFMMGASAGIKATGRFFNSYVLAGWPVKKPESMQHTNIDNTVVYYKMEVNF